MQLYTILAITNTTQAYVHWNRHVCHTVVPSEQGDHNQIRWSAVVRTHLGNLSDPAEIVGFGCTRIRRGIGLL